jgi:hypothetical protein
MPPPNEFIAQYETARKHLLKAIELVEAGKMFSGEKSTPSFMSDTTKQWLEGAKKQQAVLERLIQDTRSMISKSRGSKVRLKESMAASHGHFLHPSAIAPYSLRESR